MNGYRIIIHTPTYHNGQFIGNLPLYLTIHAETETEARAQVNLKPTAAYQVHEKLTIAHDEQKIYSVEYLGRVVTKVITEYEK